MTIDVSLTLRTEADTYAKQSFSIAFRDIDTFQSAMEMLTCAVDALPDEIQSLNKHTLDCVFKKE